MTAIELDRVEERTEEKKEAWLFAKDCYAAMIAAGGVG